MKTKLLPLLVLGFLFINSNAQLQAQSLFENNTTFDAYDFSSSFTSETIDIRTYDINVEDYTIDYSVEDAPKSITEHDAEAMVLNYALNMIAFGAGFGFNSDQTLWCLHAEYYLRLAMLKSGAIYGALGAAYNGSSSDLVNATLLEVTLKGLMFVQLVSQFKQVRFIYGVLAAYGFGNEKFEGGFKYDITRLTLGLIVGFQIMLSQQWSLMLQTNVFNYQEQTRKYDDFESKDYSRWALINKRNLLALSLIYTFRNSKR